MNNFEFIQWTGGRLHGTFQTTAVRPNLVALRYAVAQRGSKAPVRIFRSEQ